MGVLLPHTDSYMSAIRQVTGQTDEDLTFLLAHDTDMFSRWEASQRLGRQLLLSLYVAAASSQVLGHSPTCPHRACGRCSSEGVQLHCLQLGLFRSFVGIQQPTNGYMLNRMGAWRTVSSQQAVSPLHW